MILPCPKDPCLCMELAHYGHHSMKAITYPGQRIGVSAWDFLHHGHHGMQLPGFNSHSYHSVYCSDSENTVLNEKLADLENFWSVSFCWGNTNVKGVSVYLMRRNFFYPNVKVRWSGIPTVQPRWNLQMFHWRPNSVHEIVYDAYQSWQECV